MTTGRQTSDWRRDPAMAALGMAAPGMADPNPGMAAPRNGGPPEWQAVPGENSRREKTLRRT